MQSFFDWMDGKNEHVCVGGGGRVIFLLGISFILYFDGMIENKI